MVEFISLCLSMMMTPFCFFLLTGLLSDDAGLTMRKVFIGSVSTGVTWNLLLSCRSVASVMWTCLKHSLQSAPVVLNIYPHTTHLPRHTSLLHIVGSGHVITPHIILPFLKTNNTAENIARMNPNPHVSIHTGHLSQPSALSCQYHTSSDHQNLT